MISIADQRIIKLTKSSCKTYYNQIICENNHTMYENNQTMFENYQIIFSVLIVGESLKTTKSSKIITRS